MKVTPHFSLYEFGGNLTSQGVQNYYLLSLFALEKVREKFGVVKITSAYRTEEQNRQAGGSAISQHLFAEAVDFYCPNVKNLETVYRYVIDELQWRGEVIYHKKRGYIHIALPRFGIHVDQFITDV